MKKAIIFLISIGALKGNAQTKPVHISVVQGLSTQGNQSKNSDYFFSFNLFSGTVNSIKGVEIGSIYNQNNGDMTGFQSSGLVNMTKGNAKGYQTAGIVNFSGSVFGLQEAGISNFAKDVVGIQTAGIVNIAQDVKGVQFSSLYNQARTLKGFQFGIVNVADSVDKGGGIGLINLYKRGGYREVELSAADYQNIGLSFKNGTKTFYTILNVGYNFKPHSLFSTGAGIGGILHLKQIWAIKPEIIWYNYVTDDFNFNSNTHSSHFKFGLMKRVGKVGLTLSPSLYFANIPRNLEGDLTKISSIKPISQNKNGRWGFGIGLGLAFLK
ncbi:hypothetical protein [Lacihabitans soyangensis]|uniref:Uncharacterized protein n=1 Tax=Lacihabitans soyangensis TaxID=869394 RepID=A0AAE3H7K5_9BACT|nr:hypothetical protein [Lacihabitans soyangensis]MCP9765620.1 hypothetical protein [Lacihabitans soyangensis]